MAYYKNVPINYQATAEATINEEQTQDLEVYADSAVLAAKIALQIQIDAQQTLIDNQATLITELQTQLQLLTEAP